MHCPKNQLEKLSRQSFGILKEYYYVHKAQTMNGEYYSKHIDQVDKKIREKSLFRVIGKSPYFTSGQCTCPYKCVSNGKIE